jgi:hypothetical protein
MVLGSGDVGTTTIAAPLPPTSRIFRKVDDKTGRALLDMVLDVARQKDTFHSQWGEA